MHQNCQECTRLWSEYALATRHFLKLEGRLQIADLSRDEKSVSELTPLVLRASDERSDLRRQIDAHETAGTAEVATARHGRV
jgi:hypothetical protein